MRLPRSLISVAILLGVGSASPLVANWWDEMEYGPFLSATFTDIGGRNTLDGAEKIAANKGVAVKLGSDGNAGLIFDTDLLRVSGGWTNGWLKLKGVAFDGEQGANPSVADGAVIYFCTRANTPDWSRADDFTDPRPLPSGPQGSDRGQVSTVDRATPKDRVSG